VAAKVDAATIRPRSTAFHLLDVMSIPLRVQINQEDILRPGVPATQWGIEPGEIGAASLRIPPAMQHFGLQSADTQSP
jgi:hypothetical protein